MMNFPDEIWRLILSHLDIESLKNFLLVSENLRQLIIETPQLMRKLPVIFYRENWQEKIPFVEKFGECVRTVIFDECNINNVEHIKGILKLTPKIEEFSIQDSENQAFEASDDLNGNFVLENLKRLHFGEMKYFPTELFKLFEKNPFLKEFKITYQDQSMLDIGLDNFIAKQQKLEILQIFQFGSEVSCVDKIFTECFTKNPNLKLKTLSMTCELDYVQHFVSFLQSQNECLEELHLVDCDMNFHYYRMIFNNFHNLKKLSFYVHRSFNLIRIEEVKFLKLLNVKELELYDACEISVLKALLGIFPNLEVLKIEINNFSLFGILEKLPKLKKLTLTFLRIEMLLFTKSCTIREMEFIQPWAVLEPSLWKKIAEAFPALEKMTFKELESFAMPFEVNLNVKTILSSLKYFQKLKFVEIVNSKQGLFRVVEDAEQPHHPIEEVNPKFKLVLDKNGGKLFYSQYFEIEHQESLHQLVEYFCLKDVELINDP